MKNLVEKQEYTLGVEGVWFSSTPGPTRHFGTKSNNVVSGQYIFGYTRFNPTTRLIF